MDTQPIHYAVLRDQRHWDESTFAGLESQADGALTLVRLPGRADGKPIIVPNTTPVELSGLAAGECGVAPVLARGNELYIADTAQNRIIGLDSLCNVRTIVPGAGSMGSASAQFKQPRGLVIADDCLYVADSGNQRIQVLHLPSLELCAVWEGFFQEPVALASDSNGRIYVLDVGLTTILRFNPAGVPDDVYNGTLALLLNGLTLISLAVDGKDNLYITYVIDAKTNEIASVNLTTKKLETLQGAAVPQRPGAMTARGNLLYVADSASGEIWIVDCAARAFIGSLNDYRGPVTALALDQSGALFIKPGLDDTYYELQSNQSYASAGTLTAGPFDAGSDTVWERVHAELDLPEGTQAELDLFTSNTDTQVPAWDDKTRAKALDTLVTTPRRYLWLRVTLHSDDQRRTSPLLKQVQAETTAESYLRHLPAVYCRDDAPTHFLERWLALFRAELGDLELTLDEMPRRFDPLTAPESDLKWLASWLAFDPPADLQGDQLRKVLGRVHELYDRRGTPFGLREFIELYTGVRPAIFEAFRDRHVWQLGYTSTLGFDTALAAALPDGMIVPGHTLADPKYIGLRGDYYEGIDFRALLFSRLDPGIDFDFTVPADQFSIRWTGQVTAKYSEDYTFYTKSDDGVRLWVNDKLIIDEWHDRSGTEHSPKIPLAAGQTYNIKLEYYENGGKASVTLSWSSPSQNQETIHGNFKGEYYQGLNFDRLIMMRMDPEINFNWGTGSPVPTAPTDNFSVRWTGQVIAQYSEDYTFYTKSDDGVRLWVDNQLLIDERHVRSSTEDSEIMALVAGQTYNIKLEYYDYYGDASIKLSWSSNILDKEVIHGNFKGDYYQGINFERLITTRSDPEINFNWGPGAPDLDYFSVRWTGQVSPRYSERYTFQTLSDDGVRLYVDGIPIINEWNDHPRTEHSGTIELEADHWYAIQVEFYEKAGIATIKLYWSSRSQPKEIIPQERLYSVRDETAQLELTPLEKQAGSILIGQTVVGESGPLAKDDFGMPLFSENAHLFTVSLPASALPHPAQRELLRRVIEAEKPAHTDYQLCFVEPRMRVGFQARLGIDTIVVGPPAPLDLDQATLGLDSYLGDDPTTNHQSRVGKQARLGQDLRAS